jgi:hypothetical protein
MAVLKLLAKLASLSELCSLFELKVWPISVLQLQRCCGQLISELHKPFRSIQ